jgi:hypothetical protein
VAQKIDVTLRFLLDAIRPERTLESSLAANFRWQGR